MFVSLARVDLMPAHRDAYVAQMIVLAQDSLRGEAGTLRYQIIQDDADPNRIHVVEAYRDRAAFEAHMQGESAGRFVPTLRNVPAAVTQARPYLAIAHGLSRVPRPSMRLGSKYDQASTYFYQGANNILSGTDAAQILPGVATRIQSLLDSPP